MESAFDKIGSHIHEVSQLLRRKGVEFPRLRFGSEGILILFPPPTRGHFEPAIPGPFYRPEVKLNENVPQLETVA